MKYRLDIQDLSFAENPSDPSLMRVAPHYSRRYTPGHPNKKPALLIRFRLGNVAMILRNSRTLSGRAAALSVLFLGLYCFSTPEWIHRLPERSELLTDSRDSQQNTDKESHSQTSPTSDSAASDGLNIEDSASLQELEGSYRRPVSTRYSVADEHSLSTSTQLLSLADTGEGMVYYKIHTYEEWVRGVARRTIYGEKGLVQRKGPWVLFQPKFVYHSAQGPVHMDHEESGRRCIQPMDVNLARKRLDTRKRMVERKPLLYFFNERDGSLTPLAFEEEGKIYRFGFYEQLMRPYDRGTMLQETHKDLSLQTQNPHSYFREGSAFLRNYSRDPAMDVQKEMGLSTDCIQDLRPIQSSK